MSYEKYLTWTHLKDIDKRHNVPDEILDLVNVVIGLKHPGREATVELRLDSIGEFLQGPGRG